MRHLLSILFTAISAAATAHATPVYLRPDSRFPSGHYTRKTLEDRNIGVQFQRWFRVETKDHSFGWIPEDHLLTSLKLSTSATTTDDTPFRIEPEFDALTGFIAKKGMTVSIKEINGSWAKVETESSTFWLPTSSLKANLTKGSFKAYVRAPAFIHVAPNTQSRILVHARTARYVSIQKENATWIEVRLPSGATGFVRRADVVLMGDLGPEGARPLFDMAALRSAPLPFADVLKSLPLSAKLKIVRHRELRWGRAQLKDLGEIWWPMTDENDDVTPLVSRERLTTKQLFKRKVFDMASSPAIPALKFVSAEGVFRTNDGREWSRIPIFENKNYPIAIAGDGQIFIGPYMSDDHGETFQQWIRWDRLVAKLRQVPASGGLRILEVKPLDAAGLKVMVKLDVGLSDLVHVQTTDQGQSWQLLSRVY